MSFDRLIAHCRFLVCALVVFFLSECSSASPPDELFRRTGLIFHECRVGGEAASMVVDTGAQRCVVDKDFYDSVLAGSFPIDGNTRLILFDQRTVVQSINQLPVILRAGVSAKVRASILELKPLSDLLNTRVEGVVGMDVLGQRAFRISADRGIISWDLESTEQEFASTVPLRWRQGHPAVRAKLPVVGEQDLVIDTGSNGVMTLHPNQLRELLSAGFAARPTLPASFRYNGAGSKKSIEYFVVRWIDIAGWRFQNVPATSGSHAVIGMRMMRSLDVTIDCPANELSVRPLEGNGAVAFAPGGTGFNFVFDSAGRLLLREDLRSGGPAEVAEMQAGDEILEIDGKSPDQFSFWSLTDYFSRAGETVHLKCRRDGEHYEVDLTLRHPFQYPPKWPAEAIESNVDQVRGSNPELVPD